MSDISLRGCHVPIRMLVATRLVEMELPEDNVLEKLNKVSTAKRQAYMVSELRMRFVETLTWRSGTA